MWRIRHLHKVIRPKHMTHQHQCRHSSKFSKVMGIRREDYGSQWERRAPLNPQQVKALVDKGVKVIVQPSNRRAYPMQNIRLIDYEKIVDDDGKRLVAFGKFAGIAGMINILHGIGLRLLALGHHTPFIHIAAAHNYRSSSMARQAIRDAGYEISLGLLPKSVGPITFVVMGSGNVSQGALEVIEELPVHYIRPEDLREAAEFGDNNKVYTTVVNRKDHIVRKEGGPLDVQEFENHPERYKSVFMEKLAPWASCIVNGIFWDINHPRFLTVMDTKELLSEDTSPKVDSAPGCPPLPHRLLAISDITADPGGSIEFISDCTTIESPFALYDANHKSQHFKNLRFSGDGVLVCSIDNMPAQLPREATDFFGGLLAPLVPEMLISDATKPFEDENFSRVIKDSVIASNGKLTPRYEYINGLRENRDKQIQVCMETSGKRVLLLGAGNMATPTIEYLTRKHDVIVSVASEQKEEAEALAEKFQRTAPLYLNVDRHPELLDKCIQEHDLVISLLPVRFHPFVAKQCIKYKKNMLTTSYVAPEMKALQQQAVEAGVTILNELGVDPGIDHMLAMECFDAVKEKGGKVSYFESWCGGLPAPEFSENPLKYKFNWNANAALGALVRDAKYIFDGKEVYLPPGRVLDSSNVWSLRFLPGFNLEGFANRDSTQYVYLYGIPTANTIIRGTIRYKGFCEAAMTMYKIGLLDSAFHPALSDHSPEITWHGLVSVLLGKNIDCPEDELMEAVYEKMDKNISSLNVIKDLGLMSDQNVVKCGTVMDTLSHYLCQKLSYDDYERDLVILRHKIGIEYASGETGYKEISLTMYGEPYGLSAMAKSVGYPTAIGADMILEGEIQHKGVVLPLHKDIYKPILSRIKAEGINASTRTSMSGI